MRILSVIAVLGGCLLLTPTPSWSQLGPKNPQPPKPAPAPTPAAPPAGAALSKVTPEQVASALTAAGFRAQVTTKDKSKYVTTKMRNFNVTVSFYTCDAQGCGSLQFISWFSDKLTLEWVNAWNNRWRYAKAAVDKDGDLEFSLDVMASGGITLENVKENARIFDYLLDELTKFNP
jgi:hypothetical protein